MNPTQMFDVTCSSLVLNVQCDYIFKTYQEEILRFPLRVQFINKIHVGHLSQNNCFNYFLTPYSYLTALLNNEGNSFL